MIIINEDNRTNCRRFGFFLNIAFLVFIIMVRSLKKIGEIPEVKKVIQERKRKTSASITSCKPAATNANANSKFLL